MTVLAVGTCTVMLVIVQHVLLLAAAVTTKDSTLLTPAWKGVTIQDRKIFFNLFTRVMRAIVSFLRPLHVLLPLCEAVTCDMTHA